MPTDLSIQGATPQRQQRNSTARPFNEAARPDFTLKFHPARWMEIDGELLPSLSRMSHQRGVNNVDHFGDTTRAEIQARKAGWSMIPLAACPGAMTPDGQDGYVRVYQGRGPIHVTAWEKPERLGTRVIWTQDSEKYHEWLRYLMREGYVPAPHHSVVDLMRQQLMSKRDRKAGAADLNPYAAAEVKKIDASLERLDAAWAKVEGTDTPKPKRARGGK